MTTWAEMVPEWVVTAPQQVADADRMARALVEANGSAEAKGVALTVGWMVGGCLAGPTDRPGQAGFGYRRAGA